jgi:hypothetical protein
LTGLHAVDYYIRHVGFVDRAGTIAHGAGLRWVGRLGDHGHRIGVLVLQTIAEREGAIPIEGQLLA